MGIPLRLGLVHGVLWKLQTLRADKRFKFSGEIPLSGMKLEDILQKMNWENEDFEDFEVMD